MNIDAFLVNSLAEFVDLLDLIVEAVGRKNDGEIELDIGLLFCIAVFGLATPGSCQ